jgi:leucyl aminopeptidase
VVATIKAAAQLKLKRNIIALVPAVENMVSGLSYRPGDIIKMMSGKTIEIGNTDAEGRIIMADALHYAKDFKPELVIDVATLTGASISALGQRASALYSNKEKYIKLFQETGEASGDYVWPMPLWEEYESEIKGINADYSNTGKYQKIGGANTAAAFLYQFIKNENWVHLDIAPRIASVEDENLSKGAAGAPVRLLLNVLEKL